MKDPEATGRKISLKNLTERWVAQGTTPWRYLYARPVDSSPSHPHFISSLKVRYNAMHEPYCGRNTETRVSPD